MHHLSKKALFSFLMPPTTNFEDILNVNVQKDTRRNGQFAVGQLTKQSIRQNSQIDKKKKKKKHQPELFGYDWDTFWQVDILDVGYFSMALYPSMSVGATSPIQKGLYDGRNKFWEYRNKNKTRPEEKAVSKGFQRQEA
jgi:hypothetical protein